MSTYSDSPDHGAGKPAASVSPKVLREELQRLLSQPDLLPEEFKGWLVKHIDANPPKLPWQNIQGGVQRGNTGIDLGANAQAIRWREAASGGLVADIQATRASTFLQAKGYRSDGEYTGSLSVGAADGSISSLLSRSPDATKANGVKIASLFKDGGGVERSGGFVEILRSAGASPKSQILLNVTDDAGTTTHEVTGLRGDGKSSFVQDRASGFPILSLGLDGCMVYWQTGALTADSNHRNFSAGQSTLVDNGPVVGSGAMAAADGKVNIYTAGTYLVCTHIAPLGGVAATGYYVGARALKNGATDQDFAHASGACLQPADSTVGGVSAVGLQTLAAGDYLQWQAWSLSGISVRVQATVIRLPI